MTPKQTAIKDIQKDKDYPHPIAILNEKDIIEYLSENPEELIHIES